MENWNKLMSMKTVLILFSMLLSLKAFSSALELPPETTVAEATTLASCVLTLEHDVQIKKSSLYANENGSQTIIAMKNVDPDHVRRLKKGRKISIYRAFDKIDFYGSTILLAEDDVVHSIKMKISTLQDLNNEGTFKIECLDETPVDV